MTLPALPTSPSALKWAKWLVSPDAPAMEALHALFDYGSEGVPDANCIWQRMQLVGTRATPTGTIEDVAVCTFDFLNITAGEPDSTWTSTDYTNVETAFTTMLNALVAGFSNKLTFTQYRWYSRQFAPRGTTYPSGQPQYFLNSGPPARVTPISIAGTDATTQQMPYQVAISVTEKTAVPHHWGRFYLPNPGMSMFSAFGRVAGHAFLLTPIVTAYAACCDHELFPVVASGKARTLLSVRQIQIDDVPDVQRSRRAKQTLVRDVGP